MTLEMSIGIDAALDRFESDPAIAVVVLEGAGERGLCAGGDIRGLYESSRAGGDLGKVFWRQEYIMNARIAKYSKTVCRVHGRAGNGRRRRSVGAQCPHRVVTERTKLAMPEVGLGFFPDVGGTWLLSRSPGEIGTYFGLTGQTMNGPDAIHARFADTVVRSDQLPALREVLTKIPPGVDLRRGQGSHQAVFDWRDFRSGCRHAGKDRQLVRGQPDGRYLRIACDDGSELAVATLNTLNEKSPRGMVVTLETAAAGARVIFAGTMPGAGIVPRWRCSEATIFAKGCVQP